MTEARVVLQTPRLILRRWTTEDLEALAALPAEHRLAAHVFYAVEREAWRADDVRLNSVRSSIEGGV